MPGKLRNNETIVDASAGVISTVIDLFDWEDGALGIIYGANAGGNIELDASLDGTNFSLIAASTQAMDVAGAYHVYNLNDLHFRYLRLRMPATASTTVRLQSERNRD